MAVTLVSDPNDDTVPASELVERISGTRIRPKGGLSIGTASLLACDRPGAALHYTINGGEPTPRILYRTPFTLDRDAIVRARAFFGARPGRRRRPPLHVRLPVAAARAGDTEPGLAYEVFEGRGAICRGSARRRPCGRGRR
jgi:hypothetical protein